MGRHQMHAGSLVLDQDGSFDGMVAGDVVVKAGATVKITGMVGGDVVIEEGASAAVSAMVAGRIVNHGGQVSETGMIAG